MSALEIVDVTKTFQGNAALDAVSVQVEQGEIHALLGGNGSGKSTLVKILAGVYQADAGHIARQGRQLAGSDVTPTLARDFGLRFVHQSSSVFPSMTIAENFAFGDHFPTRAGHVRWKELHEKTRAALERYEIDAEPMTPLESLRPADQTMVTIARALADADDATDLVLVLDEPTASLPAHEVDIVLNALRRCADRGQSIVFVSHRLDEVLQVADAVTVLRDGIRVVSRSTEGLTEPQLIEHIVGRPLEQVYTAPHAASRGIAAKVRNLAGGPIQDVSFDVFEGEVLGIAGLLGTGRTELLQMMFGAQHSSGGTVELGGSPVRLRDPASAIRQGIVYVPEDRRADAAFEELTIRENLSASTLGGYWERFRFRHDREKSDARRSMSDFRIRARGDRQNLSELSGGNQQKVIMGRALRTAPRLLLLDEPSQGVDVGARADIYAAVRDAAQSATSVIVVTSDFEELAQVCDRVLILRNGTIADELVGNEITRDRITELVFSAGLQAEER